MINQELKQETGRRKRCLMRRSMLDYVSFSRFSNEVCLGVSKEDFLSQQELQCKI